MSLEKPTHPHPSVGVCGPVESTHTPRNKKLPLRKKALQTRTSVTAKTGNSHQPNVHQRGWAQLRDARCQKGPSKIRSKRTKRVKRRGGTGAPQTSHPEETSGSPCSLAPELDVTFPHETLNRPQHQLRHAPCSRGVCNCGRHNRTQRMPAPLPMFFQKKTDCGVHVRATRWAVGGQTPKVGSAPTFKTLALGMRMEALGVPRAERNRDGEPILEDVREARRAR